MNDEKKPIKHNPIEKPKTESAVETVRAATRAVVGAVPFAGQGMTEIVDAFLPDPVAEDHSRWQGEMTDGVNALHDRVDYIDRNIDPHTVCLSPAASCAAKYMIEHCKDGLAQIWVSIDELMSIYPDLSRNDLLEGLGDLESYDLVLTVPLLNKPPTYKLTKDSYETLDLPIMGWDTQVDAQELAKIIIEETGGIRSSDLEQKLGWPRRRLNPALRIVLGFVSDGRISKVIQPNYVTQHFSINHAERSVLRRFSKGE